MAWRRGEIWLDTEVLWFRERSGGLAASLALRAPAFFDFAPGDVPEVVIPNGLAASRQRRAELRRRRNSRRTRAAALAIGPAVMLTLAGPRFGSRAGGALLEDPPSETFRPGLGGSKRAEAPVSRPAGLPAGGAADVAPSEASRRDRKPARGSRFPKIRWHRATSHGLPYAGSLTTGTQLPVEGPNWITWNPVEDSVPNESNRLYGNEHTIRTIVSVIGAYRDANPDAPRVVVGDISLRGGGPMEEHHSHQNGLDVDLYYPRLDRALRAPTATDQIDRALAQDLLDRFVAAGAEMVFVGYSVGLHGPSGVVIPYPSHENHMHVRFHRPPG